MTDFSLYVVVTIGTSCCLWDTVPIQARQSEAVSSRGYGVEAIARQWRQSRVAKKGGPIGAFKVHCAAHILTMQDFPSTPPRPPPPPPRGLATSEVISPTGAFG